MPRGPYYTAQGLYHTATGSVLYGHGGCIIMTQGLYYMATGAVLYYVATGVVLNATQAVLQRLYYTATGAV